MKEQTVHPDVIQKRLNTYEACRLIADIYREMQWRWHGDQYARNQQLAEKLRYALVLLEWPQDKGNTVMTDAELEAVIAETVNTVGAGSNPNCTIPEEWWLHIVARGLVPREDEDRLRTLAEARYERMVADGYWRPTEEDASHDERGR
jgi:hypothetical protein